MHKKCSLPLLCFALLSWLSYSKEHEREKLSSNTLIVSSGQKSLVLSDNTLTQGPAILDIQWHAPGSAGMPVTLCSTHRPVLADPETETEISVKQVNGFYESRITPLVQNATVQLEDFGTIWRDCSYSETSNNDNQPQSISFSLKPKPAATYIEFQIKQLVAQYNDSVPSPFSSDNTQPDGALLPNGFSSDGINEDKTNRRRQPPFHLPGDQGIILVNSNYTPNDSNDTSRRIFVTFLNNDGSFSLLMSIREWEQLKQEEGITFASLLGYFTQRLQQNQDSRDAMKALNNLLDWQEHSGQYDGDEDFINQLLSSIQTPGQFVFHLNSLTDLPPGTLFLGKGKGKKKTQQEGSDKTAPTKKPGSKANSTPSNTKDGATANDPPEPPPNELTKELIQELTTLNIPRLILHAGLKDFVGYFEFLHGLYGIRLISREELNHASYREPNQRADYALAIARTLNDSQQKLIYLQVLHQLLTHTSERHAQQQLLRKLPAHLKKAVLNVPSVPYQAGDFAEALSDALARSIALSLLNPAFSSEFNGHATRHLTNLKHEKPWISEFTQSAFILNHCQTKIPQVLVYIYQETSLKPAIQKHLPKEYWPALDAVNPGTVAKPATTTGASTIRFTLDGITGGTARVYVTTTFPAFSDTQMQKMITLLGRVEQNEDGTIIFPPYSDEFKNELGITNIEVKISSPDTPAEAEAEKNMHEREAFVPPPGLEVLQPIFDNIIDNGQIPTVVKLIHELIGNPMAFSSSTDIPYSAEVMLCAMAFYVRTISDQKFIGDHLKNLLHTFLINLYTIYQNQLPDTMLPLPALANELGIQMEPDCISFQARPGSVPQAAKLIQVVVCFLNTKLHVYQIISRQFARELSSCLEPLQREWIEIGAGKGMLSAAIYAATGRVMTLTSDVLAPGGLFHNRQVPEELFNIPVVFKKAETIISEYGEAPVYLAAQPNVVMLNSLFRSGRKLLIVTLGCRHNDVLEQFSGKVKVQELNIPHYPAIKSDDSINLIMINTSREEFEETISRIPDRYKAKKTIDSQKKKHR